MVFLKKHSILLIIILIGSQNLFAQDNKLIAAFTKSYKYETEGEYQSAITELKNVYDEKSYELNIRLGWLSYNAGLFSQSIIYYRTAINLMPYSEEAKFGLVFPASASGKWDIVLNTYKKVLENSPNNITANYQVGLLYYGKQKYSEAYKHFKITVDLYPFDYDGLIMYAWTNYQLGKYREAKVLFNKVLLLSPDDASALEGLGLIK